MEFQKNMNNPPIRSALLFCLCLLLSAWTPARAENSPPTTWTAEKAVRFALRNSPDSLAGRQRIEGAQAAIAIQRSAFYPQVALVSQYGQTNNPLYSVGNILNQHEFNQTIDFNHPGRTDNLNNSIQLGYRFFDGGRNRAGLNVSQAQAVATRFELAAVQDRLAFEVVRAFNLIDQAEGLIKAHQAEVAIVVAALKTARVRYDEGMTLRTNILDLEVQEARARENLIQSQHNLTLTQQIFLNLLGLADGEVRLAQLDASEQVIPPSDNVSKRAELAILDATLTSAQARLSQARAGRYPALDGYAGYGADQGSITGGNGQSWQVGLKFQYDLFDGHRTQAEIAKAEASLNELREQRRKTELAVGLEIKQARLSLADAEERLAVSEKTVAQAEESLRINNDRFAEGLVLAADLIGAQNRLTEVQIRRTSAATARRIAIAELRRAAGLPQFASLSDPSSVSKE